MRTPARAARRATTIVAVGLFLAACEASVPVSTPTTVTAPPGVSTSAPVVPPATAPGASPAPPVAPVAAPPPVEPPAVVLLRAAKGGDGDSWLDTAGREYRLGLVNAPERGECYGATATTARTALTAGGFTVQVYAQDDHGRDVSVVTTADGTNVNLHLARRGLVNDLYLQRFRAENPPLAADLDIAFAAAKAERIGLWGACSPNGAATTAGPTRRPSPAPTPAAPLPVTPQEDPASSTCHPDYATCIPVKGNGSGRGEVNDLDCPDIGRTVQLRTVGVDPYRLDADSDGAGCE